MATRRRRRSSLVDDAKVTLVIVAFLLAVVLVWLAVEFWYVILAVVAVAAAAFFTRREKRKRDARREEQEWHTEWEAERKAWRELVWDEGPYTVTLSGVDAPEDEDGLLILLFDSPTFRDNADRVADARALVERVIHIAPQVVAEGIAQHDAVQLKQLLESHGAKVKISETARVPSSAGRREPIPISVRREVWRRDAARCVDCGSRARLEYDHIVAVANGGSNTSRNIELRCETCNRKKGARV